MRKRSKYLINQTEIAIRFSEVDAMNVVWHGNYLKFFEDGREALGEKYGLSQTQAFITYMPKLEVPVLKGVT